MFENKSDALRYGLRLVTLTLLAMMLVYGWHYWFGGGRESASERGRGWIDLGKQVLLPTQPSSTTQAQQEVVEFFRFDCPACFALEPDWQRWRQARSQTIITQSIPLVREHTNELLPRVFYTLQILKRDDLYPKIFEAIHVDKKTFASEKEFATYFSVFQLNEAAFLSTYASQLVTDKVQQALLLKNAYQIKSVPRFVVASRYVTSVGMASDIKIPATVVLPEFNDVHPNADKSLPLFRVLDYLLFFTAKHEQPPKLGTK